MHCRSLEIKVCGSIYAYCCRGWWPQSLLFKGQHTEDRNGRWCVFIAYTIATWMHQNAIWNDLFLQFLKNFSSKHLRKINHFHQYSTDKGYNIYGHKVLMPCFNMALFRCSLWEFRWELIDFFHLRELPQFPEMVIQHQFVHSQCFTSK